YEEHHFGRDEQHHAEAQMQLHHRGVVAFDHRLLDDVAPPADEHEQQQRYTGEEDIGLAVHRQAEEAGIVLVHPEHGANEHREGRDGPDDRPRTRIDEVIVVVNFAMCHRTYALLKLSIALSGTRPTS